MPFAIAASSGVHQEVYAIRFLMHQAACEAEVDPDRLGFSEALFVVSETTRELTQVQPEPCEGLRREMCARLTGSSVARASLTSQLLCAQKAVP